MSDSKLVKKGYKILILRFSSFGDVTQTLSVASRLNELGGEVHWCVRTDLAELLRGHPHVHRIWPLERREGLSGLISVCKELRKQKFTHIYDAHNNLRSNLIALSLCPIFNPRALLAWPKFLQKSQKRLKRFLLFKFRYNTYQMPFSGQRDLLEPLAKWGLNTDLPQTPQIFPAPEDFTVVERELDKNQLKNFIALCPSSAHELKRWPPEYWKRLIELLPNENFVLLGGLHDRFVGDLVQIDPNRIFNFAGRLSYQESAALISKSKLTVANDTGLLHVAEQLGKPAFALMGPAPFGFPSRKLTKIFELNLACRPCSKHGQGPCTNPKYHQCLVDITPEQVAKEVQHWSQAR